LGAHIVRIGDIRNVHKICIGSKDPTGYGKVELRIMFAGENLMLVVNLWALKC
jgi:hypothetical protein